jgi:uncharacterized protein YxjI
MTAYSNRLTLSQDVAAPSAFGSALSGTDSHFQTDKFLLNRKVLSLGNKYYLYDENQQPLFFIDRPVLKIKAHIGIYTDDTKTNKLLTLTQDSALALINQSFTLEDANNQPFAYFKRQGWASVFRRTWKIFDANNQEVAIAKEDVLWKALLRRFFKDSLIGMLFVTNYIITRPDGTKLGEFNRRRTLTDKHVADFTADSARTLDRRMVVGMCVLLDNVERTR